MKAWTLSLMALAALFFCSCSSTKDEAAAAKPAPDADLQSQWKGRIQKSYSQWQAPSAEIPEGNPSYSAPSAPLDIPPPPGFFASGAAGQTYIVKKGDTLWSISKKVYRTGEKWRSLYEANKDKVKNPDKLAPGTELTLPPQ